MLLPLKVLVSMSKDRIKFFFNTEAVFYPIRWDLSC